MNVFPRDMGINWDGDGDKWKQGEFNSVPMKLTSNTFTLKQHSECYEAQTVKGCGFKF